MCLCPAVGSAAHPGSRHRGPGAAERRRSLFRPLRDGGARHLAAAVRVIQQQPIAAAVYPAARNDIDVAGASRRCRPLHLHLVGGALEGNEQKYSDDRRGGRAPLRSSSVSGAALVSGPRAAASAVRRIVLGDRADQRQLQPAVHHAPTLGRATSEVASSALEARPAAAL
eukprot:865977-Prorocentrum_minimum.AAC.2